MQEFLPSEAYKAVINAIEKGIPFNREMADMTENGLPWPPKPDGHRGCGAGYPQAGAGLFHGEYPG